MSALIEKSFEHRIEMQSFCHLHFANATVFQRLKTKLSFHSEKLVTIEMMMMRWHFISVVEVAF